MNELKNYNRREFIRLAGLGTVALTCMPSFKWGFKNNELVHICILHTNDMHSRIDPFPNDHPQYAGLGGMETRAALVEKIRKENKNVVLLDAGDVFQGTPYFNYFGGELELKLMSQMNYEASTMGNHDFDNGLDGFLKVLPHAGFPFLCSNYDFSDTCLYNKTFSHSVLMKEGISIGIFGICIELEGLVDKKNYGNTLYLDPVKTANEKALFLREEMDCDLVICLSHLGYQYGNEKISDVKLAGLTRNIDLIIGGHTHTFLDKPSELKNSSGKKVIVSQAGWAGLLLGKIDFFFEKNRRKRKQSQDISYISYSPIKVC